MDLPIFEGYIKKIENEKIEIIAKSRWLNGVSAQLSGEQIQKLKKLGIKLGIISYFRIVDKMIPSKTENELLEEYIESKSDSVKYKF